MNKNDKKKLNESGEIVKNAFVTYKDGYVSLFDAIYMDNNTVFFGRISNQNMFLKFGSIPKENIKNIRGNIRKKYQSRALGKKSSKKINSLIAFISCIFLTTVLFTGCIDDIKPDDHITTDPSIENIQLDIP